MTPELIPPAAWGGIGAVLASAVTWVGTVTLGRRDGIRQDADYWQRRARESDKENEKLKASNDALYARKELLHQQVERLLHVNDDVVSAAATVRTEAAHALGISTGVSDAPPVP